MGEPTPLITGQAVAERLYLRPREVSKMTGLSESEVYRAIYAGELMAVKYKSRAWLISRAAVESWIDACSTPSVA